MKTKTQTKNRKRERKVWSVNDDMRSEYPIVMLDDMDIIDEVAQAEVLVDEEY